MNDSSGATAGSWVVSAGSPSETRCGGRYFPPAYCERKMCVAPSSLRRKYKLPSLTMLGKSMKALSLRVAPSHTGSPQPPALRSTLHRWLPGCGFQKKVCTSGLSVPGIGRSELKIKNEPSGDMTGFWSYQRPENGAVSGAPQRPLTRCAIMTNLVESVERSKNTVLPSGVNAGVSSDAAVRMPPKSTTVGTTGAAIVRAGFAAAIQHPMTASRQRIARVFEPILIVVYSVCGEPYELSHAGGGRQEGQEEGTKYGMSPSYGRSQRRSLKDPAQRLRYSLHCTAGRNIRKTFLGLTGNAGIKHA